MNAKDDKYLVRFCSSASSLLHVKSCTDVASNLLVVELRLDVQIACDNLQQKFQHAEYFTCDPVITWPISI